MIYGVFAFVILGGITGVVSGFFLAIGGKKHRGWESPLSLLIREVFSLVTAILIFYGFYEEYLDDLSSVLLLGLTAVINAIYVVWNDRAHALANGEEWRFF